MHRLYPLPCHRVSDLPALVIYDLSLPNLLNRHQKSVAFVSISDIWMFITRDNERRSATWVSLPKCQLLPLVPLFHYVGTSRDLLFTRSFLHSSSWVDDLSLQYIILCLFRFLPIPESYLPLQRINGFHERIAHIHPTTSKAPMLLGSGLKRCFFLYSTNLLVLSLRMHS